MAIIVVYSNYGNTLGVVGVGVAALVVVVLSFEDYCCC